MKIVEEQKKRILDKVKETNDTYILQELERIFDEVNEEGAIYQLSESQEKTILESIEQVKRGETSTHEKVFERIEKWLNK